LLKSTVTVSIRFKVTIMVLVVRLQYLHYRSICACFGTRFRRLGWNL